MTYAVYLFDRGYTVMIWSHNCLESWENVSLSDEYLFKVVMRVN